MRNIQLGILGLGNYSTTFYINELNKQFQSKKGGDSTCPFILLNTNFEEINSYLPDNFEILIPKVKSYVNKLILLGVTHIIVPNITLHQTIDKIKTELPQYVEIIHPVLSVITSLRENNISEVALFGTLYTMNSEYITTIFNQNGIKISTLPLRIREQIEGVRKIIFSDAGNMGAINDFEKIIYEYKEKSNIILACTELSVAVQNQTPTVFDMARIQIKRAVERLLAEK